MKVCTKSTKSAFLFDLEGLDIKTWSLLLMIKVAETFPATKLNWHYMKNILIDMMSGLLICREKKVLSNNKKDQQIQLASPAAMSKQSQKCFRVDFCFKIVSLLHCVSDLAYWRLHMFCPGFSVVKSGYRGFAIMQIWTIANSRLNDGEWRRESPTLIGSLVLWISYELGVWNRWVSERSDGQMELNKISHETMETQLKLGHRSTLIQSQITNMQILKESVSYW